VSAIAALALIVSLGFGEAGVSINGCAPAPQEGQKKKKESNVDRGEKVEKPPPPRVPASTRVSLTYRILKRGSDGRADEANPDSTFQQDDRIQLRVKPNRPGYLYIIQSEADKDGEQIFPNSAAGTQNHLTNLKENVIPGPDCDQKYKDEQGVGWLTIRSAAGRVWLTVYFSPTQTDRPFAMESGGKVARQEIQNIWGSVSKEEASGKYGRVVIAARNSKVVAAKIELNHVPSATADASSQPKANGSPNPTGSSGPANPGSTSSANPTTTPAVKPWSSALWGKLDREFENPQANAVRVTLLKLTEAGRVPVSPSESLKLGDQLQLDFYSNFDGYVYILHVSPLGRATVVFPDSHGTRKVKANYRSMAAMKRFELRINEKGVHTLQVVMSANRLQVLEEALEKKGGQLGQASTAGQDTRELGFDCASFLSLVQVPHRPVSVASDGSGNQAGALAMVLPGQIANQPGAAPELCRDLSAEQVKGDRLKGTEVAVFEIRFKQV
jgi:hypothetical protein